MKYFQIILAAGLLLCFAKMPYGYYNLIRYISCIVFSVLAYTSYKEQKKALVIVYASIAVLFQPFLKIALGRDIWLLVDLVSAIILIYPIIKSMIKRFIKK